MYEALFPRRSATRAAAVVAVAALVVALADSHASHAQAPEFQSPQLVYKLAGATGKLELTTNTSRILTLDKNIPRVQVNNPDLLAVTPLSANQVQISARKAGVTQVNLWDESGQIHTVDVLIYGDVRELEVALQTQFPHSSIRVFRYSESLVLKGFVDQPSHVSQIMQLASDYAPKVVNNITVGGVQQVLLKVKIMEVSRTKLRELGVNWAWIGGGNGSFAVSRPDNLINTYSTGARTIEAVGETFSFGIIGDSGAFFGVLKALQERDVAKTIAEPNIVAVSGRPAQFQVGGEFPILIPQSLGTTSIEFKPYGTQVDFLPIVLGNGNVRLEVRPRISSIDPALSVRLQDIDVPALTVRQVDTAVEMRSGQTFALAGLVQERSETFNNGLPYLSDVPVLGVPFRHTRDKVNEIELLVIVTPEFVDSIDPSDVACCGPGYFSTNPTNCQLYCAGHVEVPPPANPYMGPLSCGECGGPGACSGCNGGCNGGSCGVGGAGGESIISDGVSMPGGTGYDDADGPTPALMPTPGNNSLPPNAPRETVPADVIQPDSLNLPPASAPKPPLPPQGAKAKSAAREAESLNLPAPGGEYTVSRSYNPARTPNFVRNSTSQHNLTSTSATASADAGGLIGPVGYDAE